ncbi:MAG: DNA helicase Rep [Gammaproteobacteria bacterium]|nr:DNA helicase Rep [Gammaproteobacteria bacterium]
MAHKLNPQQQLAVKNISNPLLVLAGAGSGKTSVITFKIAHLVNNCGYSADQVAAVTFTNKAAKEMKERVSQMLGYDIADKLRVSTFHTLGLNIIREETKALEMRRNFSIFDDQDCMSLLLELTESELKRDKSAIYQLQELMGSWKNKLLTPERALAQANGQNELYAAKIYQRYVRHLKACNAVDFDDLILLPALLFQQNSLIRHQWQAKIRYLLVDEYQDTNGAQYELVKQLVGPEAKFTVVGDDDQSVYSWRGANPENLQLLNKDFPQLEVVKLEQNYRCSKRVLKSANAIISNNPHVFEKKLWSSLAYGAPIRVLETDNEKQEARLVVSDISSRRLTENALYADFAILYRGNFQARFFEKTLIEQKIPYRVSGGQSFFARAEIRDIMAYLRLLVNPDDDAAFIRIANVPRREIGAITLEKLGNYAQQRHISMLTASFDVGLASCLKGRGLVAVQRFAKMISSITRQCKGNYIAQTLKSFIKQLCYDSYLLETSSTPAAAEFRWKNVQELLGWIEDMLQEVPGEDDPLSTVVTRLVLRDRQKKDNDDNEGNEVQLLTLHAAKGLEYSHVYMVGMEEELLPHKSSIEEENIEEERRLCYVGITRAKSTLTMTLAKERKRFGAQIKCSPSRFLDELPVDDLDWPARQAPVTEVERRDKGREHIARLRAILDRK